MISEFKSVLALCIGITVLFCLSCNEDGSLSAVQGGEDCDTHNDCPLGYSCQLNDDGDGECRKDENAIECQSDMDCMDSYVCTFNEDGEARCSPDDGLIDDNDYSDGDNVTDGDVISCDNGKCPPGYECDHMSDICILVSDDDDDDDDDNNDSTDDDDDNDSGDDDDDNDSGDDDDDNDSSDDDDDNDSGDDDDDNDSGDDDDDTIDCSTDQDCPNNTVCDPTGNCVASCVTVGCNYGSCNTTTGHCEFCDPMCNSGQCCNYSSTFWYCGQCCVPSCPSGQACQSGRCVTPTCPPAGCGDCAECGPDTGWVCVDIPNCIDGDTDTDRAFECLQTGDPCMEGLDTCCSGTCLMGTCL